jgi:hypothetical protein
MNPPTAPKEKNTPLAAPVFFTPILGKSMSKTMVIGGIAAEHIPYKTKTTVN